MRNIRLTIEYDGTRFCGWQKQCTSAPVHRSTRRRLKTIQEEIEKAGHRLFGKKIKLIGSGRTDSGVHAEGQVANFKIDSNLVVDKIRKGLNSYLPKDISIITAEDAGLEFHSRFGARGKLYRYTIINRKIRSPLNARYAALISYDLDINAMRRAAKYFIGKKDFRSFQASDKMNRDAVRTIKKLDIFKKGDTFEIYIKADGFLYNMARNIVGTLIEVGRGRIKPDCIKDILGKRHRPLAGQTVPAKGLCLAKVFY